MTVSDADSVNFIEQQRAAIEDRKGALEQKARDNERLCQEKCTLQAEKEGLQTVNAKMERQLAAAPSCEAFTAVKTKMAALQEDNGVLEAAKVALEEKLRESMANTEALEHQARDNERLRQEKNTLQAEKEGLQTVNAKMERQLAAAPSCEAFTAVEAKMAALQEENGVLKAAKVALEEKLLEEKRKLHEEKLLQKGNPDGEDMDLGMGSSGQSRTANHLNMKTSTGVITVPASGAAGMNVYVLIVQCVCMCVDRRAAE